MLRVTSGVLSVASSDVEAAAIPWDWLLVKSFRALHYNVHIWVLLNEVLKILIRLGVLENASPKRASNKVKKRRRENAVIMSEEK